METPVKILETPDARKKARSATAASKEDNPLTVYNNNISVSALGFAGAR